MHLQYSLGSLSVLSPFTDGSSAGRERILRQMGAFHLHGGYQSTVTATGTYSTPGLSLSPN